MLNSFCRGSKLKRQASKDSNLQDATSKQKKKDKEEEEKGKGISSPRSARKAKPIAERYVPLAADTSLS